MICWMRGRPRGLASLASKLIAASWSARSWLSLVVFPLWNAVDRSKRGVCVCECVCDMSE